MELRQELAYVPLLRYNHNRKETIKYHHHNAGICVINTQKDLREQFRLVTGSNKQTIRNLGAVRIRMIMHLMSGSVNININGHSTLSSES